MSPTLVLKCAIFASVLLWCLFVVSAVSLDVSTSASSSASKDNVTETLSVLPLELSASPAPNTNVNDRKSAKAVARSPFNYTDTLSVLPLSAADSRAAYSGANSSFPSLKRSSSWNKDNSSSAAALSVVPLSPAGRGILQDSSSTNTSLSSNRKGRVWWLASIDFPFGIGFIRIENGYCTGTNNLAGTCYTKKQCARLPGGYPSGVCARAKGVCCITTNTCGATSGYNNTYFQNPGFPSSYAGGTRCTITIPKCDSGICQVRLDFIRFSLTQPVGGVCTNDALTIAGGGREPIRICGDNDGQHLYIDFNGDENVVLIIDTKPSVAFNRYWQIQIEQIACNSTTRAPSGCLQYYYDTTQTSGTVMSLNFSPNLLSDPTTSRQIRNLNYGICVAMPEGYCSITWSQNSFIISETGGVPDLPQSGAACTDNYVLIPNPIGVVDDRFCGSGFTAVDSVTSPFILYYVTSGLVGGGTIGFSMSYSMNLCATGPNL